MSAVTSYAWKVAAAWLSVIVGVSTNTEDIVALSRRGRTPWQRYGAPFILALRGALESYYQIEHVLEADSESLNSYKESLLLECNMVAVAAAIVASVTITTYQFPSIIHMHWCVSAAFTFSLVASLFCVYGACTLQRRISNLPNESAFRAWLVAPHSVVHGYSGGAGEEHQSANLATVLTLTAPKTLLDHSIRFFMAGLVGYLVCVHSISIRRTSGTALDESTIVLSPAGNSPVGSRNSLIICAFSLCIGISLLVSPSSYKNFKNTLSSPKATHAHGNAGLAEGPKWHGGSHRSRSAKNGGSEKTASSSTMPDNVSGLFDQSLKHDESRSIPVDLAQAINAAARAHERSAAAAREVVRAEENLVQIYTKILRTS